MSAYSYYSAIIRLSDPPLNVLTTNEKLTQIKYYEYPQL